MVANRLIADIQQKKENDIIRTKSVIGVFQQHRLACHDFRSLLALR
jgi:hypothetical protein